MNFNELINDSHISKWQATHETWKVFDQLRSNGCFCDIVLKSNDGVTFPAHRLIICTCSQYFRSLFSGRWHVDSNQDIYFPEIKSEILKKVITFAYSREVDLNSDLEAKELLLASNHLCIETLSARCIEYLSKSLFPTTCVSHWCFAKLYCCINLCKVAEEYILKNFLEVALAVTDKEDKSLMDLNSDEFLLLISRDELQLDNEGIVFFLVIKWFQRNQNEEGLIVLLYGIRWLTLPASYVEKVILQYPIIQQIPKARAFMEDVIQIMNEISLNTTISNSQISKIFGVEKLNSYSKLIQKFNKPRHCQHLIFVVGGWCGKSPTNSVEIYNWRQRSWFSAKSFFSEFNQKRRAYHAVVAVGNYIYIIGGFDGQTIFNSCDRYDLTTSKWTSMCGMMKRRCYVSVTQSNGKIFAIGGSDEMPSDTRLRSVEYFSPSCNTWTSLPDMKEQRSDAGACFLNNQIFVAGGFTGKECVASVEFYSFITNQWTNLTPMEVPRSGVCVAAYLGHLVVLGGFDGQSRLKTVEYFDYEEQTWCKMPQMLTKRSNFATCVIDQQIYVMGGFNDPSTCAETECFSTICHEQETVCSNCYGRANYFSFLNTAADQGNGDCPRHTEVSYSQILSEWSFQGLPLCSCQVKYNKKPLFNKSPSSQRGRWKSLPKMAVERSAHSCCVVENPFSSFHK